MDFTGFEYRIYSDRNNRSIIDKFNEFANSIGYIFKEDTSVDITNYLDFFYYLDEAMYQYHLENGYNVDLNNKGCFYIYSGKEKLQESFVVADSYDEESKYFTQTVHMLFDNSYYYVITLPGILKKMSSLKIFSRKYVS